LTVLICSSETTNEANGACPQKPTPFESALREIQMQCHDIAIAAAEEEKQRCMAEKEQLINAAASLESTVKKLRTDNERLNDEKLQTKKRCERFENDNDIKDRGIQRLQDKSRRQQEENKKFTGDCAAKDDEIRSLRDEIKIVTKQNDQSKKEVAALVRQIARSEAAQQREMIAQ